MKSESVIHPCSECPWRKTNQGKRHPHGFYSRRNLTRLWNGLRTGKAPGMTCHPTDPSVPEHGAKPGVETRECAGAVILVLQEARRMADQEGHIGDQEVLSYLETRKRGLTKSGILYWLLQRMTMGGVPYIGGSRFPEVNIDESGIGLPSYLEDQSAANRVQ